MSGPHVLIMAGGTGGHVYPALAVADWLRHRGAVVTWLGTRRGLEADVIPRADLAIDYISIAGLRGNGLPGWVAAPFRIARAVAQAAGVLRRRRPQVVLGMGGFVTGPGGVAARLMGVPLLVHEQNAVAGMTNRWLARLATRVMEAFPGTFDDKVGALHTGNPVRGEIAALGAPSERYDGREGPLRLFVFGGSLGAVALNETVPAALALLPPSECPLVRHQSGKRNIDTARTAYTQAGVDVQLMDFVHDMAGAYRWADLVICRAGALSVAELAAAGVPAVLVPFPYAVDDHQTRNARFLADAGAAIVVPQAELTAERLADIIAALGSDGRKRLGEMAESAYRLARPDATAAVGEQCLRLAQRGGMQ